MSGIRYVRSGLAADAAKLRGATLAARVPDGADGGDEDGVAASGQGASGDVLPGLSSRRSSASELGVKALTTAAWHAPLNTSENWVSHVLHESVLKRRICNSNIQICGRAL